MRGPDAAELLGIGRVTVFGLWFFHVLTTPFGLLGQLPYDLFTARGVLRLLPDAFYQTLFTSPALLTGWKIVLLLGCGALVLGVRPFRTVAVPVTLLLLLFDGVIKGFNAFVNHAQMGILFAAVLLCLFPAADAISVMGRKRGGAAPAAVYAGGVLAVATFLCAAYAFIGTHRIMAGGYAIFTGDAILSLLAAGSMSYSAYGFQYGLLGISYPLLGVLFKVGYAVTTLFEALAPVVLFSTWFRRLWLLVIVPFHVSTLFTMNIFFWENLLLIAVFVAPVGYLIAGLKADGMSSALGPVRIFAAPARAGVRSAPR